MTKYDYLQVKHNQILFFINITLTSRSVLFYQNADPTNVYDYTLRYLAKVNVNGFISEHKRYVETTTHGMQGCAVYKNMPVCIVMLLYPTDIK